MSKVLLCGCGLAILLLPLEGQTRLTTAATGGERLPVLAVDAGVVAFVALAGGVREVFTVPATGGAAVRRTTNAEVRVGNGIFDAWPSLSISDDGNEIAYWNAAGVHVLDIAANTDTVVATANLLPYPQLTGDGARVVFQAPVNGDHEVFVVSASGGAATQLTSNSGPGRRLPHVRGNIVVFQKLVGGAHELFTIDLTTQQVSGPHTSGSGHGNRYARLAPDAASVAWEAVVGTIKEVFVSPLPAWNPRRATTGSLRGDRLPAPSEDDEVFLQRAAANLDLAKVDTRNLALQALTSEGRAGYRRPSVDRRGTVVVYQAEHQGFSEVFAHRLCWPPRISHYGQHGTPSVGVLVESSDFERCTFTLGLATSLAPGTPAAFLVGVAQQAVPLPNAPGNFLYVVPLAAVGLTLSGGGTLSLTANSPASLSGGSAFAQWALLDPPANGLGVVSSKGVQVQFQ